jgi:hypothetical protein
MNATLARRWENSKLALIVMAAPRLKAELQFKPVRPPVATATIREMLMAKNMMLEGARA